MVGADSIVMFLYYLCATVLSTPIGLLAERDLRAWTLPTRMGLFAVIYAVSIKNYIFNYDYEHLLVIISPLSSS